MLLKARQEPGEGLMLQGETPLVAPLVLLRRPLGDGTLGVCVFILA